MPYATYSTPINASFETAWDLLLDKAQNPAKYIPYKVEKLEVHQRTANGLLREIKTPEVHMYERVHFDKPTGVVTFHVERHPVYSGIILNTVTPGNAESCGLPILTFTMDVTPHSPELEQRPEAKFFLHAGSAEAVKGATMHVKELIEEEEAKRLSKGNKNFELIRRMFLAGESMNVNNFVKSYSDNAYYQFSNFPVAYGPKGIIGASDGFIATVRNCYHHITNMWEVEKDTVVVEMDVSYIRKDGKIFRFPVADTIRIKDGKVEDLRIYMDIMPVFKQEESKSDVIRKLIKLFETMNVDEAIKLFTPDCSYRFGNYPAAHTPEGVRQSAKSTHMNAIKGVAFDIKGLWEIGDVVVCEMYINYTRTNDTILTLPCTDVFRMEGNLVKDMRIYMDATPLFA